MSNALTLFNDSPLEGQLRKAEILVKSGMVPAAYKSPEAVLAACTIGSELGFSPMQSLQVINVIDGKPTLGLNGYLALVTQKRGRVEVLELTDTICRVKVVRTREAYAGSGNFEVQIHEHEETYTLGDAAKAGLTGKKNWTSMPKKMLFARAATAGIRIVFADVVSGLYSTEEMQDVSEDASKAAPARVKKADPTPVAIEAEVVPAAPVAPSQAPAAPSFVIDVPIEPEPPLPGQAVDVYAEAFDPINPAHVTALVEAHAKVFGNEPIVDRIPKLAQWALKKGLRVGEVELELQRQRKD